MKLLPNYYPCFLGNGLDAVLVGYNGLMTPDKVGVDYCNWYKSDRYYPEEKLVKVAGRFPIERTLQHAAGSGWFEIAPLGHTWYEVYLDGKRLELLASKQLFEPQNGLLFTELDFGAVQARATTFLHACESVLVAHFEFSSEVEFQAWMAPGVWVEDGWHTTPFLHLDMDSATYDLGETHGRYFLQTEPAPLGALKQETSKGFATRGRTITQYYSILDNRQDTFDQALLEETHFTRVISRGYMELLAEHTRFWQNYFSHSAIQIPDRQFQELYYASQYHFKAAQSRSSGGLPVNNLRRTWSSHIFWDSFFIQQALLGANHIDESLHACRFFLRTQAQAHKHAQEEFGCDGLKWDWEITHDGRKAYGTLLHMKYQVHNNGSYANEIWQHFQATQDDHFLAEFLPILEGLARFFSDCIVEETGSGFEIRPLVGVNENPIQQKNETHSLAATIAILEHYAEAAQQLAKTSEFSLRCQQVAVGLRKTLDRLFNGRFFPAYEGSDRINLGVLYPLGVIPFRDPRSLATAQQSLHEHEDKDRLFPWSNGVLGLILARQGKGDDAWGIIERTRPTLCQFGGMTEVMENGQWNMQYFCTAQAAVATAIQNLMLQGDEEVISIFPALPSDWKTCAITRGLASGHEVSATYHRGKIVGDLKNITAKPLKRILQFGSEKQTIHLQPGQIHGFSSS